MTKPIRPLMQDVHAVVLVSSKSEWQELRHSYEDLRPGIALGHEFLSRNFGRRRVVFVHTGEERMEAAVLAQYAVDRWSPRMLASGSEHEAYTHVASRNGLTLRRTGELNLDLAAVAKTADRDGSVPNVATSADVQTIEDIATTEDIVTTAEVDIPAEDTAVPDQDTTQDSVRPSEIDDEAAER